MTWITASERLGFVLFLIAFVVFQQGRGAARQNADSIKGVGGVTTRGEAGPRRPVVELRPLKVKVTDADLKKLKDMKDLRKLYRLVSQSAVSRFQELKRTDRTHGVIASGWALQTSRTRGWNIPQGPDES